MAQAEAAAKEREAAVEDPSDQEMELVLARPSSRRRRFSDPSSERSMVRGRQLDEDDYDSESDDDVEYLPPRFNSNGRPLEGGRAASQPRRSTRRGVFERRPTHPGDWDVRGAWQVSGTEAETMDRLVQNITGVLEGRKNWVGLLQDVITGRLAGLDDGVIEDEPEKVHAGRRKLRR